MSDARDIDWIINHLGEERERYFGAVAPPVMQTSIFAFPSVAAMRAASRDEFASHMYTRGNNPTVAILRRKLAALEGAEDCLVFGSGMAAISAAVVSLVSAGDHVLCMHKPYSWTRALLARLLPRFGVQAHFVDASDVAEVEAAIRPQTRLIVLESPNSLTFEVQDLAAIAELARARDIRTLCDNSYASPLNQSPIALGVDLVAHSATKYINGHSDVVAGVLCGSEALLREVFAGPYMTLGAIIAPHDAWLMIRGLRTLPLRMQRIAETTGKLANYLAQHPKIERIFYPHHPSHPQHELARQQMHGGGGLVSAALSTPDVAGVERFCDALQRFLISVSWGGYESLVCPTAAFLPPGTQVGATRTDQAPANLVRFSIGLEEPQTLIDDIDQALERV